MPGSPKKEKEVFKRAPTLYFIIVMKLVKGVLLVGAAWLLYMQADGDLPKEYKDLTDWLHHWLRLNPERKFWTDLAGQVGNLTEANVVHVAFGTLIYSLFSLVEGSGLMFRWPWAGWLSIGESAFFIPIEAYEMTQKPSWFVFGILVLNVFFVWYLFQNRERLFRHHHRKD